MKYNDMFRDSDLCKKLLERLKVKSYSKVNIMEVCGTHTMSIFRSGLRDVLPKEINLISGPGCPVCVTPQGYLDSAIELSKRNDVIIATFGDLIRIPGKSGTLSQAKGEGADIRVIYSPLDSIDIASRNPKKEVVFLSVGFETTTPIIGVTIKKAEKEGIKNISFLTSNKKMPEVLDELISKSDVNIDGFLLPGHVSSIIGLKPYEFLSKRYNVSAIISGFEPVDILGSLIMLVNSLENKEYKVVNNYERAVRSEGNINAINILNEVFTNDNSYWRGFGEISNSGYRINNKYEKFDASKKFNIIIDKYENNSGCRCGDVLIGRISPIECGLFKKVCTPANPIGACMVSGEGTCSAYFKYYKE